MCQITFFGRVEPLKGRKHPAIPHTKQIYQQKQPPLLSCQPRTTGEPVLHDYETTNRNATTIRWYFIHVYHVYSIYRIWYLLIVLLLCQSSDKKHKGSGEAVTKSRAICGCETRHFIHVMTSSALSTPCLKQKLVLQCLKKCVVGLENLEEVHFLFIVFAHKTCFTHLKIP